MTFQVFSTEGSVTVYCAISISLNLIQIHSELNSSLPECGKLIYSCADDQNKKQKCQAQVIVCSGKKHQETQFRWPKQPAKEKNQLSMEEDQKSQVPISADKNCQTSNMWLPKPVPVRRLCKDQTCQSTRCYKKHSDPKRRQKMLYKAQHNWSVNQEDTTLGVTSEKLSPRSQKTQVYQRRY